MLFLRLIRTRSIFFWGVPTWQNTKIGIFSQRNSEKLYIFWQTSENRNINGRRIYPFNKGLGIYRGVYHPPFDTLKIGTYTDDIELNLYR